MPNYNELVNSIKNVTKDYLNSVDLSTFCFGKVVTAKPLEIMVEQKFVIDSANLVVPESLTNYSVDIEIDWDTSENEQSYEYKHKHKVTLDTGDVDSSEDDHKYKYKHKHDVKGTKKMKVKNALKKGDKVILFKQLGGQKYLVMDRV